MRVGVLGELEGVERGGRPPLALGLAEPVHPGLQHQFFPGVDLVPGAAALRDVADPVPDLGGVGAQVHPGDRRLAAVGDQQRREHAQGRGLAGAVGAEEPEDLALGDVEIDAAYRFDCRALAAFASREGLL